VIALASRIIAVSRLLSDATDSATPEALALIPIWTSVELLTTDHLREEKLGYVARSGERLRCFGSEQRPNVPAHFEDVAAPRLEPI
jgi:hypothetical protein